MKNLLLLLLLAMSCSPSNSTEEPFSFLGKWDYTYKTYLFEEPPMLLETDGEGCNVNVQCEFTPTRFILNFFQDQACTQSAQVELAYTLTQENDSLYLLKSNQIIRSNYIPNGQPLSSDFPFDQNGIQLIRRSQHRFVTYLPVPKTPLIAGRTYKKVYIEYRRVR